MSKHKQPSAPPAAPTAYEGRGQSRDGVAAVQPEAPGSVAPSDGHGRMPPAAPTRGLTTFVVAVCLYWLGLYLYVPLLSPQAQTLGAGVAGVGLVLASYGFVQFLLRVPTGVWSDRVGRRWPFVFAGLLACAVAAAGMGLARSPVWLGVFRGVSGLGACAWVAITLLFAEFFPPSRTAWAFGLVGFLATGAQLVGTFVGGLLAQWRGMVAPFIGAALLALIGAAVMAAVPEPAPPPASTVRLRERLGAGARPAVLTAALLAIGSHYLLFVTTYGFTPLWAVNRFHAGGAALGLLALCAGVPSAGSALLSGRLHTMWPPRRIAATGFALAAAATACLPAAPSLPALDGLAAMTGLGLGLLGPTLMTAALHGCPSDRRGSAMGFYQSIYSIGMFGGPALAGAIGSAAGTWGLFGTTAVLGGLAAAAAWRLLPAQTV